MVEEIARASISSDEQSSLETLSTLKLFARDLVTNFVVTVLGFLFVHSVVSHSQLLNNTPVYSDDYDFLASTFTHLKWSFFRPLSTFVWSFCSALGARVVYGVTVLFTISYLSLAITYIKKLLDINLKSSRLSWVFVFVAAVLAASFESVIQNFYFAGTLQNMMAGCLALFAATIYLYWRQMPRGKFVSIVPIVLILVSVLSKEDFILATGAFFLFNSFDSRRQDAAWAKQILISTIAAVFGLFLFQKYVISTQFFSGASQHYVIDFNPVSIATMYWKYLTVSPGAMIAAVVELIGSVCLLWYGTKPQKLTLLLLTAQIVSLIAPFSLLPNHFIAYFAFNWICWQVSLILVIAPLFESRSVLRKALVIAGVLVVFIGTTLLTQSGRSDLSAWFESKTRVNANARDTLIALRPQIEKSAVVTVLNPPPLGPWTASDGKYLSRKLKLPCQWLIYTKQGSEFEQMTKSFTAQKHGSVEIRAFENELPKLTPPVVKFDDEGRCSLLPAEAVRNQEY